ncbi:MAG: DUF4293 domain-containing protein [Bacteroidales bacterium]
MIQRKQTLFLLFAVVALILVAFFPIVKFYGDFSYILKVFSFDDMSKTQTYAYSITNNLPIIILWSLPLILSIVTIFLFKKRKLQMRLISISIILLSVLLLFLFLFYTPKIESLFNVKAEYHKCISLYLLLFSIIMLIFSYRGVNKDEKLVKSLDRLR